MKKHLFIFIVFLYPFLMYSQQIEVDGKIKIIQMDTTNTENLLVVKQVDGTLATRLVSSLPSTSGDTARSLQSDLFLTFALCNCATLPPAMIQSLLNNGYSAQDLIDFQISIPALFDANLTPMDLYNGGVSLDSIYGQTYKGGLIFYLDTLDVLPLIEGLVSAPVDQSSASVWGCFGVEIGITDSLVGTGQANTTAIVGGCPDAGIAARLCDDLDSGGYDDWYLPSKNELDLMWNNLADTDMDATNAGPGDPFNIGGFSAERYWSSFEFVASAAWYQDFSNGSQNGDGKESTYYVRAIRSF